jgi:KDO2-lipid IV(A) lauroyltransferase
MIDYIYLGLYKFIAFFIKIIPRPLIILKMKSLAYFAYFVSQKHRNRIHKNLDLAYANTLTNKEKRNIGIDAFINLIDTLFGIIKRENMTKEEVIQNITFKGSEILESYQKEHKNFILVTGHYGNWELLSQAIAIKFDFTLVGVGRKLDSPLMNSVLSKNREKFNVEMIEKKGAIKSAIKVINQNKTLGILTDQSIGIGQSVDVEFFANKTTHTPLASILSRKFNLDLIPAYISTTDYTNYTVEIYPPIKSIKTSNQEDDLKILNQAQSDVIEKQIRKYPNQWFWMHKRWKDYYGEIYK